MNSIHVIVGNVIADQTTQVSLIENDHMIKNVSATTSNPALRDSVLPRTFEACPLGFDAGEYQKIRDIFPFDARTPPSPV